MQWVLFGVVAWGARVIPLSPPPLGALQCMLSQAEGRSEYVSPMGFPSGAYALGFHSATGPTWLGSHWLCLLGAFRGVDRALQPELSMTNRRELRWQDESFDESLATHPGLQPTNQSTNQPYFFYEAEPTRPAAQAKDKQRKGARKTTQTQNAAASGAWLK